MIFASIKQHTLQIAGVYMNISFQRGTGGGGGGGTMLQFQFFYNL